MCISRDRFRSMSSLYSELNRILGGNIHLDRGVRYLVSLEGKVIESVDELLEERDAVCSSCDNIYHINYRQIKKAPKWNSNMKTALDSDDACLRTNHGRNSPRQTAKRYRARKRGNTLSARRIVVVLHGERPRKYVRMLVSDRTVSGGFSRFMDQVTDAFKNLLNAPIRKLYGVQSAKAYKSLMDLASQEDDCFVAVTNDKVVLTDDDLKLDEDECRAVGPYVKSIVRMDASIMTRSAPSGLRPQSADFSRLRTTDMASKRLSPRVIAKAGPSSPQRLTPDSGRTARNNHRPSHLNRPLSVSCKRSSLVSSHAGTASTSKNRTNNANKCQASNKNNVNFRLHTSKRHPAAVDVKYHILEKIGSGNFASVYRCRERAAAVERAVKIIDKRKIMDKKNLNNERTLLRRLRHKNIVNLFEEHEMPHSVYLIMEFIPGGDLFSLISNEQKLNEHDAAHITHSLSQALKYLHKERVVHRDVKPENLLVTQHGPDAKKCVKLCDFGLATELPERGRLYAICGSPTYVAPEILRERGYDCKVDVWAAGVILYIMLCGYPPFRYSDYDDEECDGEENPEHQEELFMQIMQGLVKFEAQYWSDVSREAKELVKALLVTAPDKRMSSDMILDNVWVKRNVVGKISEVGTPPSSAGNSERLSPNETLETSFRIDESQRGDDLFLLPPPPVDFESDSATPERDELLDEKFLSEAEELDRSVDVRLFSPAESTDYSTFGLENPSVNEKK